MANQTDTKTQGQPQEKPVAPGTRVAEVIKTGVLPLENISLADDSSWRDTDEEQVTKFGKLIENGDYGNTTLSMVAQVLCDKDGVAIMASDGRAKLANGKRFTAALLKKKIYITTVKDAGGPIPSWAENPHIVKVFSEGHLSQRLFLGVSLN